MKNKETAEDILQEVFVEVFKSIKSFKREAQLSTWVYRISITKCIDYNRRQKSKKRFGFVKEILGIESKQANAIPSKELSPDKNIEESERIEILYAALNKLPESQRIAITLNKLDELGHDEIARIMGTSVRAVESLIHRGKSNLKKQLEKYFERKLGG